MPKQNGNKRRFEHYSINVTANDHLRCTSKRQWDDYNLKISSVKNEISRVVQKNIYYKNCNTVLYTFLKTKIKKMQYK